MKMMYNIERMENILSRPQNMWKPESLGKRILWGVCKITENLRGGLEKLTGNHNDPKWSKLLEQIRTRIYNPRYLDSNDAIRDFESLVFIVYRDKLMAGKSDREAYQIRKDLLRFTLFLRSLSNTSGLVSRRQSGYSAFSHWMDAVYIYLENDPKPTLQGIREIAAHDSLEDPNFNLSSKSQQNRWQTPERVRQQLIKYGGHQALETVEHKLTKPVVSGRHIPHDQREIWHQTFGKTEAERVETYFSQVPPKRYAEARAERNKEYLTQIISELDDTTFRKKLADTLSNIRNIDAYVLLETDTDNYQQEWRKKMERKCGEIVEYFLSRAQEVAPSYYVQLVSELESLKRTYTLMFALNWHASTNTGFKNAIQQSRKQGIEFVKVSGRIISGGVMTRRVVLEARKRHL